jgi:hypothetical protein
VAGAAIYLVLPKLKPFRSRPRLPLTASCHPQGSENGHHRQCSPATWPPRGNHLNNRVDGHLEKA